MNSFNIKIIAILLCIIPLGIFGQESNTKNGTKMEQENIKTIHELTLSAAQKLTDYGLKLAKERHFNLAIAIVDKSGNLLAFARMGNAAIVTTDVAIGKAKTAAYIKAPSKLFEDFINSGMPSMTTTPNLLPLQGGVPIIYKEEVIGAVGISGSSGETDNEIANLIANFKF